MSQEIPSKEDQRKERLKKKFLEFIRQRREEARRKKRWFALMTYWNFCWGTIFPRTPLPSWNRKDRSKAKRLIQAVGLSEAKRIVNYVFKNWKRISRKFNPENEYPTITWILDNYKNFEKSKLK